MNVRGKMMKGYIATTTAVEMRRKDTPEIARVSLFVEGAFGS
jgi:hypothetical protein